MFKHKIISCSLAILFSVNLAYATETLVVCPTNVVCKSNQCDQTVLVPPWTTMSNTSSQQPDGTYRFIRVDVTKQSADHNDAACWLEDPEGHSILIYSRPNNVYPGTGGNWSQLSCTDFSGNDPMKCPLTWEHN